MAAENGLLALRPGGRGDVTTSLQWKYQRAVPQLPTTLLEERHTAADLAAAYRQARAEGLPHAVLLPE